ncbi:MAG: pantetheine-phosphate adenylyltransferase [Janthinobacterium sp.]|jgi:pantetheine-phosphate adenylyltransferase
MKRIGFSGTLDPITNGHMWVIGEARSMADEVLVFLSQNPVKQPQFSAEARKEIIEESARERGWNNVEVIIVKGDYTARAAKKHGTDYLIRGIRTTADFDYENLIQQTNVDVLQGAKTIFVMPPRDLGSVSSSFVKALEGPVGWNWTMKKFVPGPAYHAWILSWLRREWEALWLYSGASAAYSANADHWFSHLTGAGAYGGPDRHYHNLDHLVHGLSEIRVWAANTGASKRDMDILKKAFWFHDALYERDNATLSNEEASAQLWLGSALDPDVQGEVADLIRATDHLQYDVIDHPLSRVMQSVDLAILGQDDEVYLTYTRAIRAEYEHVPDLLFWPQRQQALRQLRDQAQCGAMFGDPYFADQYNDKAIDNLTREIDVLQYATALA